MNTLYIGIDPGVHEGVAFWNPADESLRLETLDFWTLIDALEGSRKKYENGTGPKLHVVIEASWKIKTTYGRHTGQSGERGMQKIARNAGENHGHGKLIVEYCRRNGIDVSEITPTRRKMDANQFALLTKHTQRTNEHTRDAALLVWGRR